VRGVGAVRSDGWPVSHDGTLIELPFGGGVPKITSLP
jgi:hypothetical protein